MLPSGHLVPSVASRAASKLSVCVGGCVWRSTLRFSHPNFRSTFAFVGHSSFPSPSVSRLRISRWARWRGQQLVVTSGNWHAQQRDEGCRQMNLPFPSHLDQPSRNRLARVLAQAELDRLPPVDLVLRVFEAFVGEHLDCAYERPEITADQVRAVADEFLAALTRAVYWEYPESVRLPDVEVAPGVLIHKSSTVSWSNLRQFRQLIGEELHSNAAWRDLQSAIVDIADNLAGEPASDVDRSSYAPPLQPVTQRSPKELLTAYRQRWPNVSNAAIYRACDVHSSDFYRWRAGRIAPQAALARRLQKFLGELKAPD